MPQVYLADRGVLRVAGADAVSFLQNLITQDVNSLAPAQACFAGLLSPQGKILADFFVYRQGDVDADTPVFLLECAAALLPDLQKRLALYRLRARVMMEDASLSYSVHVCFGDDSPAMPGDGALSFRDPRHDALGTRHYLPMPLHLQASGAPESYRAHCCAFGIPEGGVDFVFGALYPHDANMDRLNGVSFAKGCYIGQEIVARMEHRSSARKRCVTALLPQPVPTGSLLVTQAGKELGILAHAHAMADGTIQALAFVRLDQVAEAHGAGAALYAGGVAVRGFSMGVVADQYEAYCSAVRQNAAEGS